MSVRILTSELTNNEKMKILKSVTVLTKTPFEVLLRDTDSWCVPVVVAKNVLNKTNINLQHKKVDFDFISTLREEQKQVYKEITEKIRNSYYLLLNLYTGFGKTILSTYILSRSKRLGVVLMTKDTLLNQWITSFKEHTDAKVWVVNNNPIPNEFNVILCMIGRVDKIPQNIIDQIGFVVIDEVHEFYTEIRALKILKFHPKFIIACSATPIQGDNGVLKMFVADEIYRRSSTTIKVVIKLGIALIYKANDWKTIIDEIVYNEKRNQLIVSVVKEYITRKILILTWRTDHAEILRNMINMQGITCDVLIRDKKNYNNSQVLIGTISKAGTGFDEELLCNDFDGKRLNTLIIATPLRSEKQLIQMIGRIRRSSDPLVIDIKDRGNRVVLNQYYERRKVYETI